MSEGCGENYTNHPNICAKLLVAVILVVVVVAGVLIILIINAV